MNIFGMEITSGGLFFSAICCIVIIFWIGFKIFKSPDKKNEKENINTKDNKITAPAEITGFLSELNKKEEYDTDEEELIAVISAAVAAVLKRPVSGFKVVSFKKRDGWNNF